MKNKKIFVRIIILVIVAILVAGTLMFTLTMCKDNDFDASTIAINVKLDKNIAANLVLGVSDDAGEEMSAQAFVNDFNKTYPNIKVKVDRISGDYGQAMLARVKSNTLPDVFWVGDDRVSYFAEKSLLLNLDGFIAASKLNTNDFVESMFKNGQKNHNGSQYMIPRDYNKGTTFINVDLLKAAGIEKGKSALYPTDDWTYVQFLALLKELRTKMTAGANGLTSDMYPIDAMLNWPPVFNSFIRSMGGRLMDVAGKPSFNTPEAKAGFDMMKVLIDERYCQNPLQKSGTPFLSTKTALWFSVRPMISNCDAVNINLDVVPFPAIMDNKTPMIGAGTSGYGISRRTKKPNEAWALLSSMISKSGQEAFSTTGNAVPVRKDLLYDIDPQNLPVWMTVPTPFFNHGAFVKFPERDAIVDYLEGVSVGLHVKIESEFLNLLDRYMWRGDRNEDPDTLLKKKVNEINRVLNSD